MLEITARWRDLPDWWTNWFCEHHRDDLHRYIVDHDMHYLTKGNEVFMTGCSEYLQSLGLNAWVEGNAVWLRLDVTDPQWTWIALKA